jgi:predicted flavoprotein YhiN
VLAGWVPAAVGEALLASLGLDAAMGLSHLARDDRRRLAHALTAWELPVTGSRGYNYAEATAGGVSLDEVDRRTMESGKRRGIYLVGEMLDVDGRLGGFNFQWAWSTAWVAGVAIANSFEGSACVRA